MSHSAGYSGSAKLKHGSQSNVDNSRIKTSWWFAWSQDDNDAALHAALEDCASTKGPRVCFDEVVPIRHSVLRLLPKWCSTLCRLHSRSLSRARRGSYSIPVDIKGETGPCVDIEKANTGCRARSGGMRG